MVNQGRDTRTRRIVDDTLEPALGEPGAVAFGPPLLPVGVAPPETPDPPLELGVLLELEPDVGACERVPEPPLVEPVAGAWG
jgi:hypothetical protein